MESQTPPKRTLWQFAMLAGILIAIVVTNYAQRFYVTEAPSRSYRWVITMLLMGAASFVVGRGVTGYWRGVLIDQRNRISLSRIQMLVWAIVILSALLSAVLTNLSLGEPLPMKIEIPPSIWVLMGISTASLVASPVINRTKDEQKPDKQALSRVADQLAAQGHRGVQRDRDGVVIHNQGPEDASWSDLFKGDEIATAANVDIGKLQMFFFTFILLLAYGAALSDLFVKGGHIDAFPTIDGGMNTLLALSHSGYLATKGLTRSPGAGSEQN